MLINLESISGNLSTKQLLNKKDKT